MSHKELKIAGIEKLLAVMERLRDPEQGCPWDQQQNFSTIAPYTIEEAYEVADVIQRQDWDGLQEELGDLLLQVVYHAQMAREQGLFGFEDVVESISEKMIRRHPHVFGNASVANAQEQTRSWEQLKAEERNTRAKSSPSALGDIPLAMPALMRAEKMQTRAARVGFDWPDIKGVLEKVNEELKELCEEIDKGAQAGVIEEVGDLLFTCVNLARHLEVDAETALRSANKKFETRFRSMDIQAKSEGKQLRELDLQAWDRYWEEAKRQ